MAIDLEDRGRALENEYFRRKEQELIEKMRARVASENASESGMNCPKCGGRLVETDYENIKIDVCSQCHGVWLDSGELAQVAHKDTESGGFFGRLFS